MDTRIFTHGDGDGLCAGALALAARPQANVFFTHPFGLLDDLDRAEDGDEVIICDIALSQSHLPKIIEKLSALAESKGVIYIDHHPLPENFSAKDLPGNVLHRVASSASELAYTCFRSELGPLHTRVAIYGAIADYLDRSKVIRKLLERWDRRTVYLEAGILVQGIVGRKRDYDFKREIVRELANNIPPSFQGELVRLALQNTHEEEIIVREIRDRVKARGKIAYVLDFPFSLGKSAIYSQSFAGAVIGIAGERRKGMIDMSLRTPEEEIDLDRLLRRVAVEHGGSGGGHPMAAGARIPEKNFNAFIDDLNKAIATRALGHDQESLEE